MKKITDPKETLNQLANGCYQAKLKRMVNTLNEIKDAMETDEFKYLCLVLKKEPFIVTDLSQVNSFSYQINNAIFMLKKLASISPQQSKTDQEVL